MSRYGGYGRYGRYRQHYGRRGSPWAALATIIAVVLFGLMYGIATADYALTQAFNILLKGGEIEYDQQAIAEYAQAHYDYEFATVPHEDNALILVLADTKGEDYYITVLAGSHVEPKVVDYLSNPELLHREYDEREEPVPLEDKITNILTSLTSGCDSHFSRPNYFGSLRTCDEKVEEEIHHLTNYTEVPVHSSSVERYLKKLSSDGFSAVVVVADADEVLDRYIPTDVLFTLGLLVVFVVVVAIALFLVIKYRHRLFPKSKEAVRDETITDHDKLDEDYWKDRY